ncbi:flavodoxin family protein [Candidatus Bipolaricaulota bacterium]
MKILVAYFSETGNTKRVAEAIGEEAAAGGHDVHIKTVTEISASQLGGYDVVFLGSTCHSSDLAAPVKELLSAIPEGSAFKLVGFVTHSTFMPEAGAHQKQVYEHWAGKCPVTFETVSKEKGIGLLGFFHCQGAPSPQVEAFIRNTVVPDEKQWDEYIADARKHPTAEDIEAAREFTRKLLAE